MTRSRLKATGRADYGSYFKVPKIVTSDPAYFALGAWSVKLLIDLASQYHGSNNGDLCCTWSMMKKVGWKSPATLHKAKKQLEESGFIQLTRQGGLPKCSLYALTWEGIDECKGKLDVLSTAVGSYRWRTK